MSIQSADDSAFGTTQPAHIEALGTYTLLRKLGEGGMGAVYLANDTVALRKVAIKILPHHLAKDEEFLRRFSREARALGKLNHPNIIAAFTVGEEKGHHYFVMEFCEGEALDRLLKRERVITWDRASDIIIQVARGLAHAHALGFVHRDIKPANILLAADGTAKILDLGLSKKIDAGDEQSFATQDGVFLGTPHYVSPEQARGDPTIDGRADIYSLGSTFYHLVTGQTPYQAPNAMGVISKHLSEPAPNPQKLRRGLPDAVARVIKKMMSKNPAERYVDCEALLEDLERLRASQPIQNLLLVPPSRPTAQLTGAELTGAVRKTALETSVNPAPTPGARLRPHGLIPYVAVFLFTFVVLLLAILFWNRPAATDEVAREVPKPTPPPAKKTTPEREPERTVAPVEVPPPAPTPALPPTPAPPPEPMPPMAQVNGPGRYFLSELPELVIHGIRDPHWGAEKWSFGKGIWGRSGRSLRLTDRDAPHGLATHPPEDQRPFHVRYRLGGQFDRIEGEVGIADGDRGAVTPVTFKIIADGKELWSSRPFQRTGEAQTFRVYVKGMDVLDLKVECPGDYLRAQAMWFEPVLVAE